MDGEFWRARWSEGRIGFHEGRPNAMLERWSHELDGAKRLLVPLCGKSDDLAFLATKGFEVVGVELVEDAVRAYFRERGLDPEVAMVGELVRYRRGPVELFAGDFFDATPEHVGRCDGVYDRAAMIALPEPMRRRYAEHLRRLLRPDARALVISVEYPEGRMEGPPFSVGVDAVRELYPDASVDLLESGPVKDGPLAALGATERALRVRFGEASPADRV